MPTYMASQLDQLGEPRIYYWWALLERARRLSSDAAKPGAAFGVVTDAEDEVQASAGARRHRRGSLHLGDR
jgi:hypothetical protein